MPNLKFAFVFLLPFFLLAQGQDHLMKVIPQPASYLPQSGSDFTFDANTQIVARTDEQKKAAGVFIDALKAGSDWEMKLQKSAPAQNFVVLEKDRALAAAHYRLEVNAQRIEISASSAAGWQYGLQTVRQLLPPNIENGSGPTTDWKVPALLINDGPEFSWRGLMLDVSRHFFPKEYVLATIDRMALLKLNVLHLHLVDDQGWRIEIKKYPKLTEIGAWRVDQEDLHWNARAENDPDRTGTYGGFYSQEDIREIVAYASSRSIDVVPEIEMPAHVMSALAAYPEHSCLGEPIAVPSGGVWPITDIYCAGKESTFEFLENILLEVMELFPGQYVHVGGDEATKTNWETCPHCRKRMEEEDLEDEEELQSYFIKRMERFLRKHDKTLIGWDEILEGGLAKGATVMSWRGTAGGLQASKMGHDVVMSPGEYAYLDKYQGDHNYEPLAIGGYVPLSKVYAFNPREGVSNEEQARHILGGQGNLWSEYIATTSHSEYMLFPRLAAMAEALWTPQRAKNWTRFSAVLPNYLQRLEALGVNYAKSAYGVRPEARIGADGKGVELELGSELPDLEIRYTLDGKTPDANSAKYEGAINLNTTTTVKAATFQGEKPLGTVFDETFIFHRATSKPVTYRPSYSEQYPGQGTETLVNVFRGSKNFHDGQWQAWYNEDVEIDIDLQSPTTFQSVSVGTMEDQGSWIFFPLEVEILGSSDGKSYQRIGLVSRKYVANELPELQAFTVSFPPSSARYLRVKVKNLGKDSVNGGGWIFLDEIIVR